MAIKRTALLAFLLCSAAPVWAADHHGIAAIVNDGVITTGDVDERRDLVMAVNQIPDTPENQQKITPQILKLLINEQLEVQEATRQSQLITDEEVSKALDSMAMTKDGAAGGLRQFARDHGLSERSLEGQVKAQLAWNKVIQRKLRRNINVSDDEVLRARQSQAAAPGTTELRLAALSVPVAGAKDEAGATQLANDLAKQLKAGGDIAQLAASSASRHLRFSPPAWVPENSLQPSLQQALRELKPGDATPPLRSGPSYQIMKLFDRQTVKQQSDSTEVAIKEIAVPVPPGRDKAGIAKLQSTVSTLRSNPGSCMDSTLPATPIPAEVKFARTKFGLMNPQQRIILSHLEVGGISDPLMSPDVVQLVVLCEKIEPPPGNLPDAEAMRQQLYAEKLDLEAQKLLRNLHRDAFIDIKGNDGK